MNFDFTKIKNSKALKIALIIAVPAVLVVGYYGYQYAKKKFGNEEENENDAKLLEDRLKLNAKMREKYKDINTVDDFINGVKYLDNEAPFGYSLESLESKKEYLSTIDIKELKEIYGLLNKGLGNNTEEENNRLLIFLEVLYSK